MPKEEKVLHLIDDDEPNMEKEEEEDEHELRCSTSDNNLKMILCMTTGQQSAFCNSGCVKKFWTEGLANFVMVEAFYKSDININFM